LQHPWWIVCVRILFCSAIEMLFIFIKIFD
jgi:hypothetical protein